MASFHPTTGLLQELRSRDTAIAVVGLGYVGLALGVCFSKHHRVIGFDVDAQVISALRAGHDPIGECGDIAIAASGIDFSDNPAALRAARFVVVAVPTPVDRSKRPDFSALIAASKVVGRNLAAGSVVVYESTVYPGATENICIPVVERESGRRAGESFVFGYSPERINPADPKHSIGQIRKLVSGSDATALEVIASIYGQAIPAGIHRTASIQIAEAAKLIENTQRDLNIALINEFALICHRLDLDTLAVLEAAGSKWNFLPFRPGLVGGQCIGVSPYYLTHRAAESGYHAEVVLAGRRINDGMGTFVAQECVRLLIKAGRSVKGIRVLILGLTFKENCRDVRNSRVIDIIAELRRFGAMPVVVDPVADRDSARQEYGLDLEPLTPLPSCQAIIVAVAHREFSALTPDALAAAAGRGAPVLDVKGIFERQALAEAGLETWRL